MHDYVLLDTQVCPDSPRPAPQVSRAPLVDQDSRVPQAPLELAPLGCRALQAPR